MKKSAKKLGKKSKIVTKSNKKPVITEQETIIEENKPVNEIEVIEEPKDVEVSSEATVDSDPSPIERVPLLTLPSEPTYRQLLAALSGLLGIPLYETTPNKTCETLIIKACETYGVEPPKEMLLVYMIPAVNAAIEVYNGRK